MGQGRGTEGKEGGKDRIWAVRQSPDYGGLSVRTDDELGPTPEGCFLKWETGTVAPTSVDSGRRTVISAIFRNWIRSREERTNGEVP